MSKELTFNRQPNKSFGIEKPAGEKPRGNRKECPPWLLKKYKAFKVWYEYAGNTGDETPSSLEGVKRLSTGEWAGVYINHIHLVENRSVQWSEKFTWVWRAGKMVELSQSGLRRSTGKRRVLVKRFA